MDNQEQNWIQSARNGDQAAFGRLSCVRGRVLGRSGETSMFDTFPAESWGSRP